MPDQRGGPEGGAGQWCEPWIGALWNRLDFMAAMHGIVQLHPSATLDPAAMSGPERELVIEWRNDWIERRNAAQSAGTPAKADCSQPAQPQKPLTPADLAEFNAREAAKANGG